MTKVLKRRVGKQRNFNTIEAMKNPQVTSYFLMEKHKGKHKTFLGGHKEQQSLGSTLSYHVGRRV